MNFPLSRIAAALALPTPPNDPQITGWSIDTRTLQPGDCFLALRGPNHDGNDYIHQALTLGAAAVIADRPGDYPPAVLQVPDTQQALQHLAAWARDAWDGDVIGITGSVGKTSTKDVVAACLAPAKRTGKTVGNLNNHFGLPLSILRLPDHAEVAVLEMGMNHAGEIRQLARIARPQAAVVTVVGYAHIEFFQSIEGIAAAKRELVESLPATGTAILNADDPRVLAFRDVHPGPVLTYGLSPQADLRAEAVEFHPTSTTFHLQGLPFETPLQGRHSVRNILAGIAAASLYGVQPKQLQPIIAQLQPGRMRGERIRIAGIDILDDCYNSSPDAVRSMLDVLRDTPASRRIAVLGEMLELGAWSPALHREIGRYAADCGIDVLVGLRGAARCMADAAVHAGLPASAAFFFDNPAGGGAFLQSFARPGDAILFKGSRGTQVELALQAFLEPHPKTKNEPGNEGES